MSGWWKNGEINNLRRGEKTGALTNGCRGNETSDRRGGEKRGGKCFAAANTHLSVNECSCMQRQAKVSLSPMLWKLNRVSGPQREWNIEIVSFDCGQEMSYVWIEAIITSVWAARQGHVPNQRRDLTDEITFSRWLFILIQTVTRVTWYGLLYGLHDILIYEIWTQLLCPKSEASAKVPSSCILSNS